MCVLLKRGGHVQPRRTLRSHHVLPRSAGIPHPLSQSHLQQETGRCVGWQAGGWHHISPELGTQILPPPQQDDRSSLGTRKWLTVIGWFEWPNYSKPFSFWSQPLGLWYADTQNYCSVIKKNKGTGGNALNVPQYDTRMTQWVLGLEDSWRAGEPKGGCWGEGVSLSVSIHGKLFCGQLPQERESPVRTNPSEIPLRVLPPRLSEIRLVGGEEPHFHLGTDGAKLSLTGSDNSKTEI